MRTRDRVISFVIVLMAIGAIWYAASLFHGHANPETDAGSDDATAAALAPDAAAQVQAVPSASAATSAAVDAGPALSPACRALAAISAKVVAEAKTTESCMPDPDLSGTACESTEKGTWGFRVDEVRRISQPFPGELCGDFGYLVKLMHLDDKGAEVAEIPSAYLFQISDAGITFKYTVTSGFFGIRITDTRFFDFDGDGEDEVFVATHIGTKDLTHEAEGVLLAWKGGKIGPYEPAASLKIHALDDIDADGRPDLVLDTFKTTQPDDKGGRNPATTLRALAHSLPDGSFSTKDAVAAGYVQKQCPTPPKFEAGGVVTNGDTIACALFWGASAKDLEPLLAKSPPWTRDLSKEKPPVVLR